MDSLSRLHNKLQNWWWLGINQYWSLTQVLQKNCAVCPVAMSGRTNGFKWHNCWTKTTELNIIWNANFQDNDTRLLNGGDGVQSIWQSWGELKVSLHNLWALQHCLATFPSLHTSLESIKDVLSANFVGLFFYSSAEAVAEFCCANLTRLAKL